MTKLKLFLCVCTFICLAGTAFGQTDPRRNPRSWEHNMQGLAGSAIENFGSNSTSAPYFAGAGLLGRREPYLAQALYMDGLRRAREEADARRSESERRVEDNQRSGDQTDSRVEE
jgi:hypothetical protein